MKPFQRLTALLLAMVLLTSQLPVDTHAAHTSPTTFTATHINPLYADSVTEQDLRPAVASPIQTYEAAKYVSTVEEAGEVLREQMETRSQTAMVYIYADVTTQDEFSVLCSSILDAAFLHTGEPTEGDYLRWQYGGANLKGTIGKGTLDITFTLTYHSSAAQEAEVDAAVAKLLSQLNFNGKSDYEKVKAVYDYICTNVTYDYTSSGTLKHTAYAALIKKTAVCQGYALLLYRLLLELDIDNRLIAGTSRGENHGWNIVELDNLYYNADSTWDAGMNVYSYFLCSMDNFPNHDRSAEYATSAFNKAYPMAPSNYAESEHDHVYDKVITSPTCTEAGYTTYTCACGERYIADEVAALGHKEVTVQGTAATCTKTGLTEGTKCSACGKTITAQQTIAALGHSWNTGEVTKEPTEKETGIRTFTCTACLATKTEIIAVLEHTHKYTGVVTSPNCTSAGYTTYTCACGDTYVSDEIDALGHKEVTVSGKAATCTESGLTDGKKCSTCGTVTVTQNTINAKGHT